MTCCPELVRGDPHKISVIFLGRREVIDRVWYERVTWLANCSELALLNARAKQRDGVLCELDDEYWFNLRVKPQLQADLPCPMA